MKYYAILFFTVPGEPDPKYRQIITSVSFHAKDKWDADATLEVFEQKYMDHIFNNCYSTVIAPMKYYLSTRSNRMLSLIRQIQKLRWPEYQYDLKGSVDLLDEYHEYLPPTPYNERDHSIAI